MTTGAERIAKGINIGGGAAYLQSMGIPLPDAIAGGAILDKAQELGGAAVTAMARKLFGDNHPVIDAIANLAGGLATGGAFVGPLAGATAKPAPGAALENEPVLPREAWDKLDAQVPTAERFSHQGVYTDERAALHRKLIDAGVSEGSSPPPGEKPTLRIVTGPAGAGKSSFRGQLPDQGAAVVDPDRIMSQLPDYTADQAASYHREGSDIAARTLENLIAQRKNVIWETVGKDPGRLRRAVNDASAKGYRVLLDHLDVPAETVRASVIQRYLEGGRLIDPNHALDRAIDSHETFDKIKDDPNLSEVKRYVRNDQGGWTETETSGLLRGGGQGLRRGLGQGQGGAQGQGGSGAPPGAGPASPGPGAQGLGAAPPQSATPEATQGTPENPIPLSAGEIPHKLDEMIAHARATPMSSEQVGNLELAGHDEHALLQTPVDALDTLRLHFYATDQVGRFMDDFQAGASGDPEAAERAAATAKELAETTIPRWRAMRHQAGLNLRVLGKPADESTPLLSQVADTIRQANGDADWMVRALGALPSAASRELMLNRAAAGGAKNWLRNIANYYVESLLSTVTVAKKAASDAFMLALAPAERGLAEKVPQAGGVC